MHKRTRLPFFLTALALALVALIGVPGIAIGEETPTEEAGEYNAEEKANRHLERINDLAENDMISQEKAEDFAEALEEKISFTRGDCPEDGPRHCEIKLNLKEHLDEKREEHRANRGGAQSETSQGSHGFKGGR